MDLRTIIPFRDSSLQVLLRGSINTNDSQNQKKVYIALKVVEQATTTLL